MLSRNQIQFAQEKSGLPGKEVRQLEIVPQCWPHLVPLSQLSKSFINFRPSRVLVKDGGSSLQLVPDVMRFNQLIW